jgi:predicted outer membrane repeat protein
MDLDTIVEPVMSARRRLGWLRWLWFGVACVCALRAGPAWAAGVVGNGAPGSCTAAALEAAVTGGGNVTFNCPAGESTIQLSSQLRILVNTTIDGGGTIVLSGGDSTRLFEVLANVRLTVRRLTLRNGQSTEENGGAILSRGALIVADSRLENNQAGDFAGGAIAANGTVTLTNSVLTGNRAGQGGALYFDGVRLYVSGGMFAANQATTGSGQGSGQGGALFIENGTGSLIGSRIVGNAAVTGGGLFISGVQGVMLTNVAVLSNTVNDSGGGLYVTAAPLSLNQVTVAGNRAAAFGGGLSVTGGSANVTSSVFRANEARFGGGASLGNQARSTFSGATFAGNVVSTTAGIGGAVYNTAFLTLTASTLSDNENLEGGGGALANIGNATLINVTLSGNRANQGGHIYNISGRAQLTNVTLAAGSAQQGGGIYHTSVDSDAVTLRNVLMAAGAQGGNCLVAAPSTTSIVSSGYNLSSDATCAAYLNATGDLNSAAANLNPLAANGGPTATHAPQFDSDAVDAGNGCPATDQRQVVRPQGPRCDIGAVEAIFAPATLTIATAVSGMAPPAPWQFSGDLGAFTLASNQQVEFTQPADSYTVSQTAQPGYTVTVQCTNGATGTNQVAVALTPGANITCTFTNAAQPATLVIEKVVEGAAPNSDWRYSGDLGNFTLPAGGGSKSFTPEAGTVVVVEEAKPDYAGAAECDDGTQGAGSVIVELVPGSEVACRFTSIRTPTFPGLYLPRLER